MLAPPILRLDEILDTLKAQPYASRFPNMPGVYVLERPNDDVPWYVGETTDLRQRLTNHPTRQLLSRLVPIKVRFLVCANHREVECWLIDSLRPTLNRARRERRERRAGTRTTVAGVFTFSEATMQWKKEALELLDNVDAYQFVPGIRIDLAAIAHKLRYPMADILAEVPGDSLAARARQIGVSRQTMYVWAEERFRPSGEVAAKIAELTGVPLQQIIEYREGKDDGHGAGKPSRKARPRVAKDGKRLSARKVGAGAERGRVALKRRVGGSLLKVRKRTQGRPRGGKSD